MSGSQRNGLKGGAVLKWVVGRRWVTLAGVYTLDTRGGSAATGISSASITSA